jgi:hypothetical protein
MTGKELLKRVALGYGAISATITVATTHVAYQDNRRKTASRLEAVTSTVLDNVIYMISWPIDVGSEVVNRFQRS